MCTTQKSISLCAVRSSGTFELVAPDAVVAARANAGLVALIWKCPDIYVRIGHTQCAVPAALLESYQCEGARVLLPYEVVRMCTSDEAGLKAH